MQLFATRGYRATSISQIATRSGVSRASIFWHFGHKDALFEETCRHLLIPFRDSIEGGSEIADPRERILHQVVAYDAFVSTQRDLIRSFVGWVFGSEPQAKFLARELLRLHQSFSRRLESNLRELVSDEQSIPELVSTIVTLLHGGMLMNLAGFPSEPDCTRSDAIRSHIESILPPPVL